MEIDFSHLLLLLLFCRAADDVLRTGLCLLLQRLANCLLLVSLMDRHSWGASTVVSSCIITENSNLVAISNLYLRRLTEKLPC